VTAGAGDGAQFGEEGGVHLRLGIMIVRWEQDEEMGLSVSLRLRDSKGIRAGGDS
jgi:hypothetical protein